MAGGLIIVGCMMTAAAALVINWRCRKLNKKLDEAEGWTPQRGAEKGGRTDEAAAGEDTCEDEDAGNRLQSYRQA